MSAKPVGPLLLVKSEKIGFSIFDGDLGDKNVYFNSTCVDVVHVFTKISQDIRGGPRPIFDIRKPPERQKK